MEDRSMGGRMRRTSELRKLVFAVNGQRFQLSGIDPSTTLLEFLRTRTKYRGAKLGCGEGGCGACVVLLATYDPIHDQVKEYTVSACLTLLYSINFCSITTTEGLGNSKDGFHSIHQRFSGFHASQCGFCTPGMCMSLFSALVNADKTKRPEPPDGFSKLTLPEAEKAISGNLCRCTGYRPIVDACKSFAANVDLEDLGLNSFWKQEKDASVSRLPSYRHRKICTFPNFLKSEIKASMHSCSSSEAEILINPEITQPHISNGTDHSSLMEGCWYLPGSIDEFYELLNLAELKSESRVKMVVGNTGSGVYKELDLYSKYIDLRGIPELSVIKRDSKGIEIGAAVTISKTIEVLKEDTGDFFLSNDRLMFRKIADHMDKVASQFVRNTASLGGNLIMAQRSQFPSDIATILLAAGSSVSIQKASERLVLTLEDFLKGSLCDNRALLLSIHIPSWNSAGSVYSNPESLIDFKATKECKFLFETYRAAPRPFGNAVAYLNCAFLAHVSLNEGSGKYAVDNLLLAFGAYGSEYPTRAKKVESYLLGKSLTASVLLEAIRLLQETIVPKEGTPHSAYRSSLAVAFLFKFLHPLADDLRESLNDIDIDVLKVTATMEDPNDNLSQVSRAPDKAPPYVNVDQFNCHDMLLTSKQVIRFSSEYHPVGEPARKVGAEIQASGEAIYVDDIPSPQDCLYGAFIYSTVPLSHVKGIKFNSTLASQRVVKVISIDDIPEGGTNIGSSTIFGTEQLFADSLTTYAGQPLGVVIAESQRYANVAAKQAIVNYDAENLDPPILTVEEAVRRSSFFEVPLPLYPKQVGDYTKGMAEADHKILSAEIALGSQYYFYMEMQTALAIPDEDNCMVVYSSTQCPENAQKVIAKCLGLPDHNIRVITRRVGGGFGGKAAKAIPVAVACALAAYKLCRPVRMYLDRKTDMVMAGGRHPMKVNYSVGFKSNGKITALHIDLLINAGISADISPVMPHNIIGALKKYNWGALSFNVKVCRTNLSSKSAMRGPGEVQGSFIAEAVIEHVASVLSVDADSVRKINLHTFESLKLFYEEGAGEVSEYTLPSMFNELTSSARYRCRVEMVRQFNTHNRWTKRGISSVPIVHQVMLRPTPGKVGILNDGSIVVEVGGIEVGQGLWTKVKQMAAFTLGQLLPEKSQSLLDRVRVIQADTLSLIQGGWTAGSTTSESSCEAVRLACSILVDRLQSLKDNLQEQMSAISWDTLIFQANLQAMNLSASTYWVPDYSSITYLNFGAAVSEVEVDLLTGATTILCTDLTYDCGQSLNPAVDLGQIEGAFVQGIGFFMYEEYLANSDGLTISDGTWMYKIPTVDTIPRKFNVKILNSGHHQKRVLSSKASGEPPLLLAASIHCATRAAIRAAREELFSSAGSEDFYSMFCLEVPATMPVVKERCGLDIVERYLQSYISTHNPTET